MSAEPSSAENRTPVPDVRRYPARPIVGVGGIIVRDGTVLLVQRGREPLKGYWSVPGGAVNTGERLEDAMLREVMEETGLHVEPLFLAAVFERLMPDEAGGMEYHYVLMDYVCHVVAGEAAAGDDAADLAWFQLDEIENLRMTPGTYEVIVSAMVAYDVWRTQEGDPRAGLYLRLSSNGE